MAKTKKQKQTIVEEYKKMLEGNSGVFFIDNPGVKVNEITELRKKLGEIGGSFHILKNRLFKLALNKEEKGSETVFEGATGAVFAGEDISPAGKILKEFVDSLKEKPVIKGGILNRQSLDEKEAQALTELPSREELLAKVVYMFNAPLSGLANVLSGNIRNLVYALNAVKENKE